MTPSIVALIPARAGSKRVPGKNVRLLGDKPLLAWAIEAAKESGIFREVAVCTDSEEYGDLARSHGATYWPRRASEDDEPDIIWINAIMGHWFGKAPISRFATSDALAILRPTSPFRTAATICRAWQHFLDNQPADSLRAVEPVKQHPGKMWVERGGRILPLLPWAKAGTPWHSSTTQSLPAVYVQNASLEIAWTKTVTEQGTIAGTNVLPFDVPWPESLDINTEADWQEAERILARGDL